jgi:hypothetical protein
VWEYGTALMEMPGKRYGGAVINVTPIIALNYILLKLHLQQRDTLGKSMG